MNEESLKIGLTIHKGKTEFMTKIDTIDNIPVDGTETEKVNNNKYLGHTIAKVGLFVGYLTSQQHASVLQGQICSDICTCCHTETM